LYHKKKNFRRVAARGDASASAGATCALVPQAFFVTDKELTLHVPGVFNSAGDAGVVDWTQQGRPASVGTGAPRRIADTVIPLLNEVSRRHAALLECSIGCQQRAQAVQRAIGELHFSSTASPLDARRERKSRTTLAVLSNTCDSRAASGTSV
jgi:hypothetical protein